MFPVETEAVRLPWVEVRVVILQGAHFYSSSFHVKTCTQYLLGPEASRVRWVENGSNTGGGRLLHDLLVCIASTGVGVRAKGWTSVMVMGELNLKFFVQTKFYEKRSVTVALSVWCIRIFQLNP